jgi:hypothetical protein
MRCSKRSKAYHFPPLRGWEEMLRKFFNDFNGGGHQLGLVLCTHTIIIFNDFNGTPWVV